MIITALSATAPFFARPPSHAPALAALALLVVLPALALLFPRRAGASQPPLRVPRGGVKAPRRRDPDEPAPARPRLKAVGAFAAAAVAAAWIALSYLGGPADPDPPGEQAEPESPAEPERLPAMSFKIEPPPEVVTNPAVPEEPAPEPEAGPGAGPSRAVGGVFAPEELEFDWATHAIGPVRGGAAEMAPLISRMEPVGRRLDPERPVPKAARIELKPPDPEADPKPNRPRLTAPPQPPRVAPPPPMAPGAKRRYTIIIGSFTKESNALALRERLEGEGLPAEVVSVTVNNQPWWRVMSGVFDDQAAAEAYGRELRAKNLALRPYIMIM
ncbi:MAG: SPOR domain-containing protein [Deltaproteobacteria bacterium]|nr:SPOR domain-containing protein [Deltaproteobacteria bacterium]